MSLLNFRKRDVWWRDYFNPIEFGEFPTHKRDKPYDKCITYSVNGVENKRMVPKNTKVEFRKIKKDVSI